MHSPAHPKSYLAFDLGAESGRAVLANLHLGVLTTKELRPFPNQPEVYASALQGMRLSPASRWTKLLAALEDISVDACGVDYALVQERAFWCRCPECVKMHISHTLRAAHRNH